MEINCENRNIKIMRTEMNCENGNYILEAVDKPPYLD